MIMGSFIIINFVSIFLFNCLRAHFLLLMSPPRKSFAYPGVAYDAMSIAGIFFSFQTKYIVQNTEFLQSYVVPNSVLIKFIHVNIYRFAINAREKQPCQTQFKTVFVVVVLLSVAIIKKK